MSRPYRFRLGRMLELVAVLAVLFASLGTWWRLHQDDYRRWRSSQIEHLEEVIDAEMFGVTPADRQEWREELARLRAEAEADQ